MPEKEEQISAICLSCGMCCDGTLFTKATVNASELQALQKKGFSTFSENDKSFLKLPCSFFCEKCSIYNETRAQICGDFFCYPLIQLQKDKLPFEEVKNLVHETLKWRNRVKNEALNYPELSRMSVFEICGYINELLKDNNKQKIGSYGGFVFLVLKLNSLLRKFHKPQKEKQKL